MRILGPGDLRGLSAPLLSGVISTAVLLLAARPACAAGPEKVDFARQVRPILAENCFECHGPDPRGRKGKLRLDSREDVFGDRGGYRLVVPGHPEDSELIARIASDEPDEVMPPPESRRQLTKAQVELLTRWVAEGASWSEHWSFIPPRRPSVPDVSSHGWSGTRSIASCWRDSTGLGSSRRPKRTGSP